MKLPAASLFTLDHYTDRFLPHPPLLPRFPAAVSYALGYRRHPPPQPHPLPSILLNALAVFITLLLTVWLSHGLGYKIPYSLGATGILLFCAPTSPLAQPRNTILSQVVSAVIGVGIARAVEGDEGWTRWTAGTGAVGVVSVVLRLTGTVHPPAGATALLAVLEDERRWGFVGVVAAGSAVLCVGGMVVGGLEGQGWPVWWWREEEKLVVKRGGGEEDLERGEEGVVVLPDGELNIPSEWKQNGELMRAVEEVRRCLIEAREKGSGDVSDGSASLDTR